MDQKGIPYAEIAEAYDYMLRHVDYQQWYEYICRIMLGYVKNPETVLELGCGTGKFGAKFSADGFDVLGIDLSLNMLRVAKTRAFRNFRIMLSDMQTFKVKKKFDFIFSVHDTMNYQLTMDDVRKVLENVKHAMHRGSIFLFDITTEYNVNNFFDEKTSVYSIRGMDVEWSNSYDRENRIITSNFLVQRDGRETKESHIQKIHTPEEIKDALHDCGFEIHEIFSDYSFEPPDNETVMINFVTSLKR